MIQHVLLCNLLFEETQYNPNLLFEMKHLFCENPVWSNPVRLAACLVVLHRFGILQHIFILFK